MLSKHAAQYTNNRPPGARPGHSAAQRLPSAAAVQDPAGPLPAPFKVVGCGSCGVDYLASVAAFPRPDDKLRTDRLEVQGGGNAANALTAAARLGLAPVLLTKIGGDGLGDTIVTELQGDDVDTSFVLREPGHPSPFTYIIVDRQGGTRTCIHTPGAALGPEEVTAARLAALLEGASLVYFDGRLTEAALVLARAAKAAGVPLLVEGERLRPHLDQLLQLADYVVTSQNFPREWTGEACLGDALVALAAQLPRARTIITTLGAAGSVMLERSSDPGAVAPPAATAASGEPLEYVLQRLQASLPAGASPQADEAPIACVSASGVEVRAGGVTQSGVLRLAYSQERGSGDGGSAQRAAAAVARAAALNADAGGGAAYAAGAGASTAEASPPLVARVTYAQAAGLPKGTVVDTTGAGDAFIGSVVYGLVAGLPPAGMVRLAAVVAACKCTALGARPGLPQRERLSAQLLAGGQAG